MTTLLRAAQWTIAGLRWRRAARRTAARAYRAGEDVIAWWGQVMATTADSLWPEPGTQTPCPVCEGRRCAGCEEPARNMAPDTGHTAMHTPERLPQSIVADVMLWASPVDRARSASLRVRAASARLLRAEVLARPDLWARRLGREPLVGTFAKARLP